MTELTKALDGTSLRYTYSDGGALKVTYHGGLISYEWISGPFAGTRVTDLPYQAREIVPGVFMVNFHVESDGSFATLVVDFNRNAVFSSAIVSYRSEQPVSLFDVAEITDVSGRGT